MNLLNLFGRKADASPQESQQETAEDELEI